MRKKPCSSPCSTQTRYPSNVSPQGNQYAHGTWYDTHPTDTPTICNQPVGLTSGIISAPADNLDRVAALEQTRDMLVHAFARKRQAQFSRPSQARAARLRRQSCAVRHPAWLGVTPVLYCMKSDHTANAAWTGPAVMIACWIAASVSRRATLPLIAAAETITHHRDGHSDSVRVSVQI